MNWGVALLLLLVSVVLGFLGAQGITIATSLQGRTLAERTVVLDEMEQRRFVWKPMMLWFRRWSDSRP